MYVSARFYIKFKGNFTFFIRQQFDPCLKVCCGDVSILSNLIIYQFFFYVDTYPVIKLSCKSIFIITSGLFFHPLIRVFDRQLRSNRILKYFKYQNILNINI